MKYSLITIVLLALAGILQLQAADSPDKTWKYVDSEDLRIINKGFGDSERTYSRFPAWLKDSVRKELWDRQAESAGMGIRFATNSSRIGARYHLLRNGHMLHMADTGLKGSDLYILEGDSVWRHVNTNRPAVNNDTDKMCETTYVSNLDTTVMREYMIYFPLYDGILDFEVKVDSNAKITAGNPEVIRPDGRILCYGTSIMQGGCASRTGMAASTSSSSIRCPTAPK